MFNNHFFFGRNSYLKFVSESNNVLIIIDPPYGGLVKLIANTINCLINGNELITIDFIYMN